MNVKISDFIAEYLVSQGINYNFTVPGGGAMHLNVSLGHQAGMTNIFMQHEQAAAIAAEAYYRKSNQLPLVCCTTGPGGTNTLTGVLGAWLDSIPMLIISGQVKYQTTVRSTGLPMRILGDQEFDITSAVKPMTKYAEMVIQPEMVKYHLQKAVYLAKNGRPGPVWLDIPLDIQWGYIDTDSLIEFNPEEIQNMLPRHISNRTMELIVEKIKKAKRPVLYTGVEIRTADAYDDFRELSAKLNIPIVTSFDGIDLMADDDSLYAGRAGDVGDRFGNWAVQNSDMLLVIGNRLGIRQIGHTPDTWAREAFVVMVHPDPLEVLKPRVHIELPVRSEVKDFIQRMNAIIDEPLEKKTEWIDICNKWKKEYPVVTRERHCRNGERANVYWFINELSGLLYENTTIVSANGSACVAGVSAFHIKEGQRFLINCGAASMGYDLPAAIGACFADAKKEVICLAGDGSIQMNLQELQTIVFHKLPVKIFVINNEGYHSMRQTQNNLFKGISNVGVGPETGDLGFPDMEKIAEAYGIPYRSICNNMEMTEGLNDFLNIEGCAMCEVFVDTKQVFEPKPAAMKLADGRLVSPPMEDLAPFLPREELRKIMIIPLMDDNDGNGVK